MLPPNKTGPKKGPRGNRIRKKFIIALALSPAFAFAALNSIALADTPTAKEVAPKMPAPVPGFEWAYPMGPAGLKMPAPDTVFTATGADPSIKYTFRQITDPFGPPDWFPKEHVAMPPIVAHGEKPHVIACILCHLPNGNGHPESASVSGLSVKYII